MRIECGSTRERIIRNLLMLIMFGVFGIWFTYDGFVGYPQKNKDEHIQQLTVEEREGVTDIVMYETVTDDALMKAKQIVRDIKGPKVRDEIEALFGGPPSFESQETWWYFGPYYRIRFNLVNGKPVAGRKENQIIGAAPEKTATSISWQKRLGAGLSIFSLYLLVFIIRVARTKFVLDENGLTLNGKGPIAWDSMKSLDTSLFSAKGWVDLIYDDGGTETTMRLDEYHLASFDDAIDQICKRKGFDNPLPVKDKSPNEDDMDAK